MSEYRSVLERAASNFAPLDLPLERVERGRNRRGRKRRIAAGIVGISVFVAAVWIVTSVGSLDRSKKSVVPAGTGPVQTGPAETESPPARASAAPDVVEQRTCSDGALSRLELTIEAGVLSSTHWVRFEVHRSPVGHGWRITLRKGRSVDRPSLVFYQGIRVARHGDDLAVTRPNYNPALHYYRAKAVDRQTGQVCKVKAALP